MCQSTSLWKLEELEFKMHTLEYTMCLNSKECSNLCEIVVQAKEEASELPKALMEQVPGCKTIKEKSSAVLKLFEVIVDFNQSLIEGMMAK